LVIIALFKKEFFFKEGGVPFECGFGMLSSSGVPFSFQFFLVALLFLIFDVEISVISSYPLEPVGVKSLLFLFFFLRFLSLGLLYE
jgi:NADH:ubiquinone oxidoreductase subunit 3 (subunit A)